MSRQNDDTNRAMLQALESMRSRGVLSASGRARIASLRKQGATLERDELLARHRDVVMKMQARTGGTRTASVLMDDYAEGTDR